VEAEITRRGWTLERVGAAAYGCAQGGWRARKGGITRGGYRLEHVVEQVREHEAWEAEQGMTTQLTQLQGDCLDLLPTLPSNSAQCIVTSPPYWRMRRYTDSPDEIGQEATPAEYVEALRRVFAECRRVLRDDGVLFLNLGDAYANDKKWGGATGGKQAKALHGQEGPGRRKVTTGLPPKSLIGLPWRVAFALQDDGWVLRSDVIWHKPNPIPENVEDRPTRAHEYVFLFSKRPHYFYDGAAIAEPSLRAGEVVVLGAKSLSRGQATGMGRKPSGNGTAETYTVPENRNARTVWAIAPEPLADEHYAPMPQALAERCIRAGSRPGDCILDPFAGSGTTLRAAIALGRRAVGIELGAAYLDIQNRRTDGVQLTLDAA
jgi:DNA modification methylase